MGEKLAFFLVDPMIFRMARWATRPLHQPLVSEVIPYEMFDVDRTAAEARAARTLAGIYHKGQDKAWDGKTVLEELLVKHDGIHIDPEHLNAIKRLFALILWGEMAAWKVSAELALVLEPLEAKMAASSQAHDEARHFYVMFDYLQMLGYEPEHLPIEANRIFHEILTASSLAKKLLGMQLMVEPIALSIFQIIRERKVEPVLCDLLALYEVDEARHLALGVQYLPALVKEMNPVELADFYLWQLKMFMHQLDAVTAFSDDFIALGVSPREVIRLGELKQLHVGRIIAGRAGQSLPIEEFLTRAVEARIALDFPETPEAQASRIQRWRDAINALIHNAATSRSVQRDLDNIDEHVLNAGSPAA